MDIVYKIGHSLYLNITNRCTNTCSFCVRFKTDRLQGYNLKLAAEPTVEELISAIGDPGRYREVVFCGYGEPLLRLPEVLAVARYLKEKKVTVRLNTNGHGNLIYKRNIVPELAPYIDVVSVSLNAENAEQYQKLCQPDFGPDTYQKVKEFILECKQHMRRVIVTAVALPGLDIKKMEQIATEELGVSFRLWHDDDIVKEKSYGK